MSKGGAIRWTPEQLAAHEARNNHIAPARRPQKSGEQLVAEEKRKRGVQALGRMKVGAMNKTEAAYAATLEQRKQSGEVGWFKFEGLKFRLADNTFYTPDFAVMLADGSLEAHEVKVVWLDDARAKIKIAADMYPIRFLAALALPKKKGGGWKIEEF